MKQDSLKFCNILISSLGVTYLWHQFSKLFSEACLRQSSEQSNNQQLVTNQKQIKSIVQPVGSCLPSSSEILAIMDFFIEITSVERYENNKINNFKL